MIQGLAFTLCHIAVFLNCPMEFMVLELLYSLSEVVCRCRPECSSFQKNVTTLASAIAVCNSQQIKTLLPRQRSERGFNFQISLPLSDQTFSSEAKPSDVRVHIPGHFCFVIIVYCSDRNHLKGHHIDSFTLTTLKLCSFNFYLLDLSNPYSRSHPATNQR